MDDIDDMLETLRLIWANLASLEMMDGPEFLLPGRTEKYHETLTAAQQAQQKVETLIYELGQRLIQEQQRLDEGEKRFGWHHKG